MYSFDTILWVITIVAIIAIFVLFWRGYGNLGLTALCVAAFSSATVAIHERDEQSPRSPTATAHELTTHHGSP